MKQLTVVTIVFLPLSFLTGYFGMNFTTFTSTYHSETYFWEIALPVSFVVAIFLMRDMIYRSFEGKFQKRGIKSRRKGRLQREKEARRQQ
jgi:hypothetical protein